MVELIGAIIEREYRIIVLRVKIVWASVVLWYVRMKMKRWVRVLEKNGVGCVEGMGR